MPKNGKKGKKGKKDKIQKEEEPVKIIAKSEPKIKIIKPPKFDPLLSVQMFLEMKSDCDSYYYEKTLMQKDEVAVDDFENNDDLDGLLKVDKKISLHCSSLNQAINKESILFWINEYNVKRIILPRNLSFIEIIELCEYFPDIEFEIFVKNTWCYNSNWNFCSSLHFEWLKKWISPVCFREKNYKSEDKKLDKWFHDLDNDIHCKICILWKLKNIKNIVSLKIVWREKVLSTIMKDLKFVKRARDKLFNTNTYYEFVEWSMNIYEKEIGNKCSFEKCEYYNYYYKK